MLGTSLYDGSTHKNLERAQRDRKRRKLSRSDFHRDTFFPLDVIQKINLWQPVPPRLTSSTNGTNATKKLLKTQVSEDCA